MMNETYTSLVIAVQGACLDQCLLCPYCITIS